MVLSSCLDKNETGNSTLFELMKPEETGIDFINQLKFDKSFNIYTYRNYYNGGGVAIGDINNDGLMDIYFTSNQSQNQLYLNKGNFQFENITTPSGVGGSRAWSTGVSMVDINADGWIDIYVCNSGDIARDNKQNELFINNGDLTFSESAESYGLADQGFSTQAAFFDYDKDGDLDVYLLNNSYQAIGSFNLMQNIREERDEVGGDKLYRNDGGKFRDVSVKAGIYGSIIGFGLGVTVGDINNDGWQDIFVSNDFFEKDYLYINQQDGTFKECLEQNIRSISAASMGADMADINNDLHPDIFVTDMLPEPDNRLKQVTTFESWDKYIYKLQTSYYHQFSRNMLHINNGDGSFTELGRFAGVEATDWSWGALIFDMDNDGMKDLFVANGIYQDITDLDYLNFVADDETKRKIISKTGVDYAALVDPIPINPIPNYAFQNQGSLRFQNKATSWGLSQPSHSNGAVYADLDNDGDMDLVVSNVNTQAFIYQNNLNKSALKTSYIKFSLNGLSPNLQAFGTKIYVTAGGSTQYLEVLPIRGFQSTVDPRPNFGLGNASTIEEVKIVWPSGKVTILNQISSNQHLILDEADAKAVEKMETSAQIKSKWVSQANIQLPYRHSENQFVDFDRDRLTYYMRSNEGPASTKADVNGDGLEDVFLGGAKGFPASLLIQQKNGIFIPSNQSVWQEDERSEDVNALFFDADNDGDQDLFVVSGGNEFGYLSPELSDRLYMNDGTGKFKKSTQTLLSNQRNAGSVAVAFDYDQDGDFDLLVSGRLVPFLYGIKASSYIYENDGKGNFKDVTAIIAPGLLEIGMVTDASSADIDNDGDEDLILVGEWMSPVVFNNKNGSFQLTENGMEAYSGWWYSLKVTDLDNDGNIDLLMGNHGLNSRLKPTQENPMQLYVNDFDENGSVEHLMVRFEGDRLLPYALKHDLIAQMPSLKKKYLKYANYNDQTLTDIFTPEQLENAVVSTVNWFASSVAWGNGDGTFTLESLPNELQYSPVYAWSEIDLNQDGSKEIIAGGNLHRVKPQMGIYDANHGSVLQIGKDRKLSHISYVETGLLLKGEVRDFHEISIKNEKHLLGIRNNDSLLIFKYNQ